MHAILDTNEVRLLTEHDTGGIRAVTDMMWLMYLERYGEENVAGFANFEEAVDRYVRRGRTFLFLTDDGADAGFAVLFPSQNKLLSKRLHEWIIMEFFLHPDYRDTTLTYRALNWMLQQMDPDQRVIGVCEMGSSSYYGSIDRFPIKSVTFVYKEKE